MRRISTTTLLLLILTLGAFGAPAAAASDGFGYGTVTGGSNRSQAHVVAVRMARHAHFDRFVVQFDGKRVPRFTVAPKSSSIFWLDPSDKRVDLLGRVGIKIVLRGTTGQGTYTGARDFRPRFPQLREARLIGDFEAVTSWGLGLRRTEPKRVIVLTAPPRLVIDVHH